jgi:hypothetical protein
MPVLFLSPTTMSPAVLTAPALLMFKVPVGEARVARQGAAILDREAGRPAATANVNGTAAPGCSADDT